MKPAETIPGVNHDCLRLCVASILEMHPRRVPHFVKRWDAWLPELCRWLERRGYTLTAFHLEGLGGLRAPWVPKGYWIAIVDNSGPEPSSWGSGSSHAIVMRGRRKVYDPQEGEFDKRRRYFCGYQIYWLEGEA